MTTTASGDGMSKVRGWVSGIAVPCLVLLGGCDSGGPERDAPAANFDRNGEAVRFVRGLRENVNVGQRPAAEDVERLKQLALQYPGEPFIEEVHLSLLPVLEDWEGLVIYLRAKGELDANERSLLSRACIRLADYAGARDAILPAAQAAPQSIEANALLGRACYFLGQFAQAKAAYDRVWEGMLAEGRVTDIAYRAMIDFEAGESERALGILAGALKAAPESAPVLNSLARVHASQGNMELAETYSAKVARLQDAFAKKSSDKVKRAARIFALNKALSAKDYQECERMVFDFLPESNQSFREELYRFLERLYKSAGRQAEFPAVLERARAIGKEER